MKKVVNRAGLVVLTFGLSIAAQGATIYDNGSPNRVFGVNMSAYVVAENFSIAAASNISNIRFWSVQSSSAAYLGNVFWAIYANAGSQPGAVLQGNTTFAATPTATGLSTGFGSPLYAEYLFNIPVNFQLAIGHYWLGLSNSPRNIPDPTEMLWGTTSPGIGSQAMYLTGSTWVGAGSHLAFRLDGTAAQVIPEPSTFALLAGGLAAAAFLRRKF